MGSGREAVAAASTRWWPAWLLAGCAVVFAAVSLDVTHDGALVRSDLRVARWVSVHATGEVHAWSWRLTHTGDAWLLALVVAVAAGVLALRGRWPEAVLLVVAAASVALITTLAKEAFRRTRPPFVDPAHRPHSFSYPSGHASGAFAVYVLVTLLFTVGMSARARVLALAGALALALLVATTRVVIPVHYLSDVIAGAAVGLAVVATALLVRARLPRP